MYDPKFEKQVRQKMEELSFSPSEAVWARVEREIGDKKRRPAAPFWFFFLLGGILLGAGGVLFYGAHRSAGNPVSQSGIHTATQSDIHAAVQSAIHDAAQSVIYDTKGSAIHTAVQSGIHATARYHDRQTSATGSDGANSEVTTSHVSSTDAIDFKAFDFAGTSKAYGAERAAFSINDPTMTPITSGLAVFPANFEGGPSVQMGRMKTGTPEPVVFEIRGPIVSLAAVPSKWEAGFSFGAGFSSLAIQGSHLSGASGYYTLGSVTTPNTTNLQSSQNGHITVSDPGVTQGLALQAGVFAQKRLFPRLNLVIGLNLHYYSTHMGTGQKVNNPGGLPNTNTVTFLNPSAYLLPQQTQVFPYYLPGVTRTYTNHYYFLELPLSLAWKLNHSTRHPLFWEGGLSLSRLMSTDALYFNTKTDVYESVGTLANPVGLSGFTSLLIGFSAGGYRFKLGPELQYGFTPLLNVNEAASQHLYYGGLKILLVPKKW